MDGIVYVKLRVRQDGHGSEHGTASLWLGIYAARDPNLDVGSNSTVFLDADNEVQPDAFLFWRTGIPFGVRLTSDGYVEGTPPLVVEITAGSESYDLHDKMNAYRRTGVREYIVWRTRDEAIDWFRLHEGAYTRVGPDADGIVESSVFPGLRLSVPAMLARDRAAVLAALTA